MAEARRTRPPVRGRKALRRRRLAALCILVLVILVGTGVTLAATGDDGTAPAKVRLDGVDVSGKAPEDVTKAARRRAAELMREPVVITRTDDPSSPLRITRAELGARPQIRRAVDEVLQPRSFGGRVISYIGLVPTREVHIRFTLDPRKVSAVIRRLRRPGDTPARAASLKVTDEDIAVVPGSTGSGIDPEALRAELAALPSSITVTPGTIPPPVSDAAAAAARARALRIVAHPVAVTFQGRGVEMEQSVLRSALRFVPDPPDLRVELDPETLHRDIASAFSSREQPARDATFAVSGSSVRLVPSRIGRSLDMEAIAEQIVASPDTTAVRARFKVTRPERTTAQAKALKITEEVSEFTTPYNCCEPRVTNIQRAAQILDGTIIPAGGRFSLNEALGRRTLDNGFVSAPQIAGGRLEEAVGGGVSQVSTTLYNAAFFAGLELVAHTPHQFWISRYPKGREATLSYGGPEMIFVNDWPAAILMSVTAGQNSVTVRFFSSKLGRRVETTTGEPTDVVQPTTHEEIDPTLKPGERVVDQEMGGEGFTISYTRKVFQGETLKRDETYTWKYDPEDAFIRVGPPKAKPERPAGTTPQTTTAPPPGTTAPAAPSAPATPSRGGTTTSSSGAAPPP